MARGDMARLRARTGAPIRRGAGLVWHLPGQDLPGTVLSAEGDCIAVSIRAGGDHYRYLLHPADHITWTGSRPAPVPPDAQPLPIVMEA